MSCETSLGITEFDLSIAIDVGLLGNPWQFKNPDGTYQTLSGERFELRFYPTSSATEESATWSTDGAGGSSQLLQIDTAPTPDVLKFLATPAQWAAQIGKYYRLTRIDSATVVSAVFKGWVKWV